MVMKAVPDARLSFNTFEEFLDQAAKASQRNRTMVDNISRIKDNIQILANEGLVSRQDDYAALRKDAAVVSAALHLFLNETVTPYL